MSHIRSYFVSGAKFNRPCGLGFAAENLLTSEDAQTLGLIISESMCFVFEPRLLKLAKDLGVKDEDKLTLGDFGTLVHAEVSRTHGTRIAVSLPSWTKEVERGIFFSFKLVLAQSIKAFVRDIAPDAPWVFPITINEPGFIMQIEEHLGFPLQYSTGWILSDGISKLRRYQYEYDIAPEHLKVRYIKERLFLQTLTEEAALSGDSGAYESMDGSVVTTIGKRRSNINHHSQVL